MTHNRTSPQPNDAPPGDEVMGRVIAKWKGWGKVYLLNNESSDDGMYWDFEHGYGPFRFPVFHQHKKDSAHDLTGWVFDPRTNTDAALELLWALDIGVERMCPCNGLPDGGWAVKYWGVFYMIPTSGPAFRVAVCNLAARVLGVE